MANFEAFLYSIKLSIILLFLKSVYIHYLSNSSPLLLARCPERFTIYKKKFFSIVLLQYSIAQYTSSLYTPLYAYTSTLFYEFWIYLKDFTDIKIASVNNSVLLFSNMLIWYLFSTFRIYHSLIRGVLIQRCPAGAKNFTNYVFCHPQFSGVYCLSKILKIVAPFWPLFAYVDCYQNNQFYRVKISF